MMKFTIKQSAISYGSQYKIFHDKREEFYAETDMFSNSIINLYRTNSPIKTFTIIKSLYLIYPKYKIEFSNGERLSFQCVNFWRTKFQFQQDENIYELYCHKERKVSVFKNKNQIAYWQKEAISLLAGDYYKIIADEKSPNELIITFCIILDNILSKGMGTIFNVDFGIIFKELKKFDKNWKAS